VQVVKTVFKAGQSGRGKFGIEKGHDGGSSLTTRLSFGHSGIRVGFAGAFVQRVAPSLLLGRFSDALLWVRTATTIALETNAARTMLARRLARGRSLVHVAGGDGDGDSLIDNTDLGPPLGSPRLVVMAVRVLQGVGGWTGCVVAGLRV
jgi:hypothetical protein